MVIPRLKYQKINVPSAGATVDGTVLSKEGKILYVDVSPLGLAVVRGIEFIAAKNYIKNLSVGDKISVVIVNLDNEDGLVEASLKEISANQVWNTLYLAKKNSDTVFIKIKEVNRGGLIAEYMGIKGFLPVSQLTPEHYPLVDGGDKEEILARLRSFVNTEIPVKILDLDKEAVKLIFSEREVLNEEHKQKLAAQYQIGDIVDAEITKVVDFGLFVKFGEPPIDGLVHISEVDYKLIPDLKAIYKETDKIKAKIESITNGRIALSIKALKPDPWKDILNIYKVGKKYDGIVLKTGTLGVLVELEPGVYGFLKFSELKEEETPKEPLEVGKTFQFSIKSLDTESRRITLGL
jgi:small subunit ribosomal protein S1